MRQTHIVPLASQVVTLLRELHLLTGPSRSRKSARFVFPALTTPTRPMSENTENTAIRRLGYSKEEMTAHGFRSLASTRLNEGFNGHRFNREWIERQLAHAERNTVTAAYNYAEYLPERRQMMQAWADYLDSLRAEPAKAAA
jgi:integrase